MIDKKIITSDMIGNKSFTEVAAPDDYVEEKIVDYFLNCLCPATQRHDLIQCGEPYSSAWDKNQKRYRTTYITFHLTSLGWQYCGACFLGETKHMPSEF